MGKSCLLNILRHLCYLRNTGFQLYSKGTLINTSSHLRCLPFKLKSLHHCPPGSSVDFIFSQGSPSWSQDKWHYRTWSIVHPVNDEGKAWKTDLFAETFLSENHGGRSLMDCKAQGLYLPSSPSVVHIMLLISCVDVAWEWRGLDVLAA